MSKLRYIHIFLALIAMLAAMPSCNSKSSDDEEEQEITYANVTVTSFALGKNEKILAKLDSVFFSIDLNSAVIFNADSLPKGTSVDKLTLSIGLPSVSSATLIESPGADGKKREIDYLSNKKDSVDFSLGDVTLRLVSYDKSVTRDYTIKVNVHKAVPDSLYWNKMAARQLPGTLAAPVAQKTVRFGSMALCIATDGSASEVSASTDPGAWDWTTVAADLPAQADIATLTPVGDKLYMLDYAGALYSSSDGASWTAEGVEFHWLYGAYDGQLLASRVSAGRVTVVEYPSMAQREAPEGFPADGTSELLSMSTEWAAKPTAVMVGGRCPDGSLTSGAWAFDGAGWSDISVRPISQPLEGMTLCSYFSYLTNTNNWSVNKYTTLIAIGGRDADGTPSRELYYSLDAGLRWTRATSMMSLPSYIPAMSGAQALVFPTLLESRASAGGWVELPSMPLPLWYEIEPSSRAVAPITEWECPYIYLFGGVDAQGSLMNTTWRGVISRLTFKPLQ